MPRKPASEEVATSSQLPDDAVVPSNSGVASDHPPTVEEAMSQIKAAAEVGAPEQEVVVPTAQIVEETPVGIEAVTFSEPFDMPEPKEYKKTATVLAVQVPIEFSVVTMEGMMNAKAGDYLCGPGVSGEFWPVDQKTFEQSYEEVNDGDVYDGVTGQPLVSGVPVVPVQEDVVMDELDRKQAAGEKGQVWTS